MSAPAKPISEVIEDFEQSLESLRPSTRRVYVAGAKAAIRAACLELWQSPSTDELLAVIRESPTEKRISPFLAFLGDAEPKNSLSDEDIAGLQSWVIQTLSRVQIRGVKQPSLTSRRDLALIAAMCTAPARGTPRKMACQLPQSQGKPSASVGRAHPGTGSRSCLALLARLAGAAGPTRPTPALARIFHKPSG